MPPTLWVLAGGDGAGKSTFHHLYLRPLGVAFVNADQIARTLDPVSPAAASYEAARVAMQRFADLVQSGDPFAYETVFSHPSKVDMLGSAKSAGYAIVLVCIHLDRPELHQARVRQRVGDGGRDVPDEKIVSRLPRTQAHIAVAARIVDEVRLLDNSLIDDPFSPVAAGTPGNFVAHRSPLPPWARDILGDRD